MKKAITIAAACMLTTAVMGACSLIAPKIGPEIAKGVSRYCMEPQGERVLIRASINAQISPNHVELTCAGDTPAQ